MNQLLLKNYEILNNIKTEYDKLLEENKSLKEQLNNNTKEYGKCQARLFKGGYNIENMTQCDKNKVTDCYCLKHSKELLYGNINIKNTDGWRGHAQPHAKSFIKKMNEYFNNNNKCYARIITKGNDGWFNFKRCRSS